MSRGGLAAVVLAAVVAGCGGDGGPLRPPAGADVRHIHGLGVNPSDGSLLIATHTGLFRVARGEQAPNRIGPNRQDTMGFTVVGADRFLGSGHPDAQSELPPLLGLIRSQDAGRSWESVSLLGDADFHVLRAAGRNIYGFDATSGRLLASADAGETWDERSPPAPLVDLAVDPARPTALISATEAGLFSSRDAGGTWRPLSRDRTGLIAWTAQGLFLVDGDGRLHRSVDGGRSFEAVSEIGGQPAAFNADGGDLYVALHTNEVKLSSDGGRSWSVRVTAG